MSRTTYLLFAVLLLAIVAGCARSERAATATVSENSAAEANRVEVAPSSGGASEEKPTFRAELTTEPGVVKAGEPVTLILNVKNAAGAQVRGLDIVHEKPMHLLVTSSDLAEFYHIHPESQQRDGSYRVTHTFPHSGDYKLYADFTPRGAPQVVERLNLKVTGGEPRARVALVEDTTGTKTIDGLRVVMRPDKPLRGGEELMLNFAVADARTGKPATDLQPYLGALAHFVIINEDGTDFLHAHPMSKEEMTTESSAAHGGKDHDAKPHAHNATKIRAREAKEGARSPSEVAAHTTFPRGGIYKVWAQFQRGGRVITVPYVVRVAENQTASATTANSSVVPAADAIKVTVSSKGYEPSRIEAKKGQPVKLAFYRADAKNCGGEVVFSSQAIRKKLPVGQTVIIEVTPKETGDLAFTCGMGMLRGALVVVD